jgi:hypothetical protein
MCWKRDLTLGFKSGKKGLLESIVLVKHESNSKRVILHGVDRKI